MLQRYFDVITNSMTTIKNDKQTIITDSETTDNDNIEQEQQEQQQQSTLNELSENQMSNFDDTHEMNVLNEIYNLSDRIIASSLQCRSYDINSNRKRLTYADIQAKGSDILDEAKHLLYSVYHVFCDILYA